MCGSTSQPSFVPTVVVDRCYCCFFFWACSSFKTLVAEASAEETAAKEASDAKAEAEAAKEAEAEAKRQAAAKQAKLEAAKSSMEVVVYLFLQSSVACRR